MTPSIKAYRGIAILFALLVMSIVAIIALTLMTRFSLDVHRTELLLRASDNDTLVEGSIAWALAALEDYWQHTNPYQPHDFALLRSPQDSIRGTTIQSTIISAEGRFNLNNLTQPTYHEPFLRLIQLRNPNLSPTDAKALLSSILDWITPQTQLSSFDRAYAQHAPSYRAPHRAMASSSECRLVQGMTPAIYRELAPFIIALPHPTRININAADAPLLMSLSPTLTPDMANTIITQRQQHPFATLAPFFNFSQLARIPQDDTLRNILSVMGEYYLVTTDLYRDTQHLQHITLVKRNQGNDNRAHAEVVWQTWGTV